MGGRRRRRKSLSSLVPHYCDTELAAWRRAKNGKGKGRRIFFASFEV